MGAALDALDVGTVRQVRDTALGLRNVALKDFHFDGLPRVTGESGMLLARHEASRRRYTIRIVAKAPLGYDAAQAVLREEAMLQRMDLSGPKGVTLAELIASFQTDGLCCFIFRGTMVGTL